MELCDPTKRQTCKNRTEIINWLSNKYIVTLQNEAYLNTRVYDTDKVVHHSVIKWYIVNNQFRQEYVNEIEMSELELQDTFFHAGNLTK